jgi:fermentation-respiration switch protein FrsA (DUF1100 family)
MVETHRIRFESRGAPIVGDLFVPAGAGRLPAVVVDDPLTSVKEQAQSNHARALAEHGCSMTSSRPLMGSLLLLALLGRRLRR